MKSDALGRGRFVFCGLTAITRMKAPRLTSIFFAAFSCRVQFWRCMMCSEHTMGRSELLSKKFCNHLNSDRQDIAAQLVGRNSGRRKEALSGIPPSENCLPFRLVRFCRSRNPVAV